MTSPNLPSSDQGLVLSSAPGRWVVAVTVAGSGMAFLDGSVVNVALPDIGRDLGATTNSLQWVLNGYLLALASLILLGGALGDHYGRRKVFVVGAVTFSGASVLCALAPTVEWLIAARVAQGVGAALLTPGSLAIIEATMRPDQRGRAIGLWSGLTGVASAVGPLVGGYLISAFSWRAIFFLNVPIGAFVIIGAQRHVPETRDPTSSGSIDVTGALLGAAALAGLTVALTSGSASTALVAGSAALVAGIGFLITEARSSHPMLPLSMFRSSQFSSANVVTFLVYAATGGFFFLFVAFLQISLGYSPLEAGAATLPVTILMLLLSARSGAVAQRIGPRIPLTVGPLVIAAGLLLLTGIDPGDDYVTDVLPAVVVLACGLVILVAPITTTVLEAAGDDHAGVASGVNNAVARIGSLLAIAALPTVTGLGGDSFYVPSTMTSGFHGSMLICAGLSTAGGVVAALFVRSRPSAIRVTAPATPEFFSAVGAPPLRTASGEQ